MRKWVRRAVPDPHIEGSEMAEGETAAEDNPMTEIDIDLDEFIDDVRAGISDEALQAKHKISGKRFLIAKAAAKDFLARRQAESPESQLKVDLKQILADVKAGISNEELMTIYNLTSRQLQTAFRRIIGEGLASPMDISGRLAMTTSQVVEAFTDAGRAMRELE
jgi:hypothetical protein